MEIIRDFIQSAKNGEERGSYSRQQVSDYIYVEASVGSFQYGIVYIRIWITDRSIDPTPDMNFRRLHKVDDGYRQVQNEVNQLISDLNERTVDIAFEPTLDESNSKSIMPSSLDKEHTYSFSQSVQIRDDVSVAEALLTNRDDDITRSDIENSK